MDAGTAEKTYVAVITAPEGRRFNAKRLMKGRKPPMGEFAIIEVQDEFITGEYVGGVDGMREELPGIANAAEKAITEQRAVEAGEREKEAEKRKREEEAKKKEEEVRKHREEEPQKEREAEELKELKAVTKRYRALVEKHEETCGAKPEAAECVGSGLQRYQKEVDELELKMYEIETRCKTCLEWVTGQAVASASAVDGTLEGKLLGHWPLVTLVDPAPGERVPNPRWHWRIDARRAPHGAVVASTFTNGQGYYRLARLLPGSYWVTARKAHIAWVCEGRRVSVRSTVDYDFPCVRR